jgi:hypothetical protein
MALSYTCIKKINLLLILVLCGIITRAQSTIYLHDFGSTTISAHPYTIAPGTFDANFSASSWSNSASAWTSFAGSGGQAIALNNSSGTPTITLTFSVAPGYSVSITQFNFWRMRSSTGAQNWSMTINGTSVGSGTVPTTGAALGATNVSNAITGLTNTVTVVISLSGASGTGTFRFDDFQLTGTVSATTSAPVLSTPTATSITQNSATLGATITYNGGASITNRGTSYKTSSPVVATDNQLNEGGTSVAAYSHSRTSLNPQTQYFYAGYATNSNGTGLSSESSFRTLSEPPTVQAASASISSPTGSTLDLTIGTPATFPASGATQAGYAIIYATGTPTLSAANGQAPAAGTGTLFTTSATTLPATPSTNIQITGLSGATAYNVLIVPYTWDGTNAATYHYLTASAPTASGSTTIASEPTAQATFTSFTANNTTSFTINFGAGTGGSGRLVVLKQGSAVDFVPVDGNTYTANTSFTGGTGLGTNSDNKVVYSSNGTSVSVTNLTANTTYHVAIYEYNGTGTAQNYLTSNPATSSTTSMANEPASNAGTPTISNVTPSSFNLNWTAGTGIDGYLVVRRTGGTPETPTDGVAYAANDVVGTSSVAVYSGSSLTVAQSSLAAATAYQYRIYSYNGSGTATNYRTSAFASGTFYTLSSEPASHAASFTNTVNSATSITLNFTASAAISASGYLLLRKSSTFTGSDYPADGTGYANNDVIGGATVVTTITNNATTSFNNTVAADGSYYYLLVPFNWDGTNTGTRNYYTGGTIANTNAATPSGASDLVAVSSSESATVASTSNASSVTSVSDGVQVWQFTIRDGGASSDADALPTKVTSITIGQSAGNQINDFSNAIQSIALFNGSVLVSSTVNITSTQIQFTGLNISVPDNSSLTLTLRLSVKTNVNSGSSTGQNADGDDFGFQISNSNITLDVPANSSQASSFSSIASTNSQNVYSVSATALNFVQQPNNVNTYTNMSPSVTVEGVDAGGNRDLQFTASVNITATGATLVSSPATATAGSGLATFSSIQFNTAGIAATLAAQSTGLSSATSSAFDVNLGPGSYTYRTLRSGDWKEVSSGNEVWERSADGNTWSTVTLISDVPASSAGSITIQSGHTVSVAASVSVDQLTIASGGQLTVNASQTLTIADGSGTDLQVNGTLQNSGGTITLTGTASFGAGSTLRIGTGSGSDILSANATYDAASTIEITGVVAQTSYTFPTKSIGNLVWNNASQTSNINTSSTVGNLTINGNVTIQNTGSGTLRFAGSANLALVVAGNFNIQSGASLDIDNNASGTTTISIGGNFNMTGGTFQSSAGVAGITLSGSGKTFTQSSGTFTGTNLNWTIGSAASVTLNNDLPVAASRTVTVNGTLNCGTKNITGSGAFTLASTGTLGIGSIDGIATGSTNGNIRVTGSRTYNAAATFAYNNSSSSQVTGNGLPATVANITINNSNGVSLGSTTTVTGTLTLQSGQFDAANMLTLNTTGSLVFSGGSIVNFTIPATINNYTIQEGVVSLNADIAIDGTLDLGSNILDIGNHALVLGGDVTRNTGTIRSNGGTVTVSGSTQDESLFFDQTTPGTTNSLASLIINRASSIITLGNTLNVTGTVTPTTGTLASGGNLVLVSSLTGTGRIAALGASADITGDVTVQRYLIGGSITQRGWRTMCSPVQSFTYSQLIDDILVTGPGGSDNGFDASGTNASVRYYEESATRGWKSIATISDGLGIGKGMLVFFRGDRTQTSSLTNSAIVPNDVVADFTGPINKNSIVVPLDYEDTGIAADDGFNFVGNPYPCEIIWDNISKTPGVDVSFWILNPNTGNYVSQTGTTQIASGQGFLVQVNGASESITFDESNKSNGNPTSYFKTSSQPFTVKMFEDSARYDIAWLSFAPNASKNYVFKEDTRKLKNPVYNLSFVTPDAQLVQRNVSEVSTNISDTFVMQVSSTVNATYTLSFEELNNIPVSKDIFLLDLLTNTTTNIRTTPHYSFQVSAANPASSGNRFKVIFTGGGSLPVKILSFTGSAEKTGNKLVLEVAQEKNISNYEVLRSTDGRNFEKIATLEAKNSFLTKSYSITDNQPLPVSFYKVKVNELNGGFFYTHTISINNGLKNIESMIYPNPATDKLFIEGADQATIRLYSLDGRLLSTSVYNGSLDISNYEKGIYLLELHSETLTQMLKFIKK